MTELYIIPEILDSIDLCTLWPYARGPQFKFFNRESGNEHYRLLSHLSWQFPNKSTVVDIGTSTGHSALALSHNPTINVVTYNISDEVQKVGSIKSKYNVNIRIKNCLDDMSTLLAAPFIMLDVFNDGTFEKELITALMKNNYAGVVLCDDIYLNKEMVEFWKWVPVKKVDMTKYGHWSGTGLILFGSSSLTVLDKKDKPKPPFL